MDRIISLQMTTHIINVTTIYKPHPLAYAFIGGRFVKHLGYTGVSAKQQV